MADDSGIDPRYAAQFQRGYDPARHASARREPTGPVRLSGGPPPSAPRVPDPPRREHRAIELPSEPVPADGIDDHVASRAPWIEWALLALGVLLVALAVWTFGLAATDIRAYTGVDGPGEQVFAAVRNSLPGPLLVAGVGAITVWVMMLPGRRAR